MKVLLINECHYRMGGADIVYLNEGKLLEKNGIEVMYFAPRSENIENSPYCEFFYPAANNIIQKAGDSFYNFRARKYLNRLLYAERPDIVHLHCFLGYESSSIYGVLKKHHIPIVHTVHDYRMVCPANHFLDRNMQNCEQCKGGKFYKCILRRCSKGNVLSSFVLTSSVYFRNLFFNPIKNIDGFIFVSNFSQQKHIEHDHKFQLKESIVLYNSTPLSRPRIDHNGDYILYIGRLSVEKGVDSLVKAFSSLTDVKLKIVGEGPLKSKIQGIIESNHLYNIDILGYKQGEELTNLIQNSKYVIVPSICYENNPMAVVEAFAFSKPVLGALSGAIPEFVKNGKTGFLFEKANEVSMVETIKKAMSLDIETYKVISHNTYAFFQNNFKEEIHVNKLIEFYFEIINS